MGAFALNTLSEAQSGPLSDVGDWSWAWGHRLLEGGSGNRQGRERIHRRPSLLSPDVVRLVGCANKAITGQISQAEIHAWHNMPQAIKSIHNKSLVLLR